MVNLKSFLAVTILGLQFTQVVTASSLNLTAISAKNGKSILECWEFPGVVQSTEGGIVGTMSLFFPDTKNTTYSVIPAGFESGLHTPPSPQFVVFLSGLVHITLPNATGEAWIQGGRYGVVIAADVDAVSKFGHLSTYPGDADTVALQIPFGNGICPDHIVLHHGACTFAEMIGM